MSSTPTCPVCDDPVEARDDNDAFPFCSTRCKHVDLGRWLDEDYTVPMTPHTTERSLDPDETDGDDQH
ncbi:MAG: DNA gyrase inhibitor YacG [Bradymonadaceae bacterium]